MGERREIRVEVFTAYSSHEEPLATFLSGLNAVWGGLTERDRNTARVMFEGGDYDTSGSLLIYYTRLETQDEAEKRTAEEAQLNERYRRERESAEKAEWKRLMMKYGVPERQSR